jgi:pentatricopeptide repeat protein
MKHPTNISWSTVINAYAQAGGAQEAAALLEEMEEGRSADLPIVVYNNVIHAWSRSSDPNASKNAEAILNRLESGSNRLKLPKPDIISYRLTLNALEHTKDPDKAGRTKSVLDRFMVSLRAQNQPLSTANNQIKESIQSSYNSVLAACAYTPSNAGEQARSNAARILVETFRDINHGVDVTLGPNQESFAIFLQGCTHLFQPDSSDRMLLIRSALQECCEKGLLNAKIWNKFCSVSSVEDVQSFISAVGMCDGSRFEDLPLEWSRNSVPAIYSKSQIERQ